MPDEQPVLTDGVVTLRPWRDDDVAAVVAGRDDEVALWFGRGAGGLTEPDHLRAVEQSRADYAADRRRTSFVVERDGEVAGSVEIARRPDRLGDLTWTLYAGQRGRGSAARAVRVLVDWAFTATEQGGLGLQRVEARVDPRNEAARRVATRAGLRQEGVQRVVPGSGDRTDSEALVVYARLVTDPPLSEPGAFRALLNSFLPRKRAIGQMLVRDPAGRVLLCQLTYKPDWDLPGGVVEVGESPREAVEREVVEELGLAVPAGDLLLTDWLPPWSGWDDALCLVFDGGVLGPEALERVTKQVREIRSVEFCTLDQVRERAADFTARRVEAALRGGGRFTESGRDV